MAMGTKCTNGKFNNTDLIKKIVDLSHQRAKIIGYDSYADFILEKRMAKTKKTVMDFLDDLYNNSYNAAKKACS